MQARAACTTSRWLDLVASRITSSVLRRRRRIWTRCSRLRDSAAHVYTLTGTQATAAQLKETLAAVARDAKAEDDFVLILIGHGSFDGVEYKFNLVGPDVTAGEICGDVRSHCRHGASLSSTRPAPAAERCRRWSGRGAP